MYVDIYIYINVNDCIHLMALAIYTQSLTLMPTYTYIYGSDVSVYIYGSDVSVYIYIRRH